MHPHLLGVDHVVILTDDLDAAQARWTRLGFNLTPRGFHSIGTRNHCMMLGNDYLELMSVATPHPVTRYFSEFLAGGDGAGAIALATDDSDACRQSLQASGIAADAPVDFSRPVETAGTTRDARFRVTQLPVTATPGCRTFLCQHFTPELVWLPPYQRHPLGVRGIAGVTMIVADRAAAVSAYARVAGIDPIEAAAAGTIRIGSFTIDFVEPSAATPLPAGIPLPARPAPVIGALHLRVDDVEVAARQLAAAGFQTRPLGERAIALAGQTINGTGLTFRET
ncbi:MAG: VOC family protein [Lautropia sp.]